MDGQVSTTVTVDDWRFTLTGGQSVEVENTSHPYAYASRHVECPHFMRHSDLEMFARGWAACFDNVSYYTD